MTIKTIKETVLDILQSGEQLTIGQIRKKSFFSHSAVRKELIELVEAGLVVKSVDADNTGMYEIKKNQTEPKFLPVLPKLELQKFDTESLPAANDDEYITNGEAMKLLSVGKTKFYELIKLELFPQPLKYCEKSRPLWNKREILTFREGKRLAV